MIEIKIGKTGPLWDGRLSRRLAAFGAEVSKRVADKGLAFMLDAPAKRLRGAPFKRPTGHYRSQLNVRQSGAVSILNDSGVVYGKWLAGTGSRNAASRFKGYKHWRLAQQYISKISLIEGAKLLAEKIRGA